MAVGELFEKGCLTRISADPGGRNGRVVERCHLLGINEEGFSAQPVEKEREIETFISQCGSETIVYFGFCRVADRNQVRFVDLTVAVDVFVFDIAGHVRSESLNRRIGYVGFVDEQPFGDIAPLLI